MKLIKPSFEIIEQQPGIEGMLKHIEQIGRVCYKSEDKITSDSYKPFVEMLKDRKHGAMLEHGTVYLLINNTVYHETFKSDAAIWNDFVRKYRECKYSTISAYEYSCCITTNYRVIVENGWEDDLQYWSEPTEFHVKRHSVKFICCRGVSHEFVRNRGSKGNTFAQESTRYCNYSKDKHNNEITFIEPLWLQGGNEQARLAFVAQMQSIEKTYIGLIEQCGWSPQQAREVLPNALKTELVLTCYDFDWKHFLSLRADKAAHPQAQELAFPLKAEFERLGIV